MADERKQQLRFAPVRSAPPRHLYVRLSTLQSEYENRGLCLTLPVGENGLVIGSGESERLLAITRGALGLALASRRDRDKWYWAWSALCKIPSQAKRAKQSWISFEVSGPLGPKRQALNQHSVSGFAVGSAPSLGCQWQTEASPVLGRLRGILRLLPARQPQSEGALPVGRSEAGWLVAWDLPQIGRGAELQLGSQRSNGSRQNLPEVERHLGLVLVAEPWSGCEIRSTFSTSQRYLCRDNPGTEDHKVLLMSKRSLVDLHLTCQISPGLDWRIRCRHVGGDLILSPDDLPKLGNLLRETDPVMEETESLEETPAWWGREMGGISTIALRWRSNTRWRGGLTLAATPEAGGGRSAVPIRIPPGRSYWRLLGGGNRFCEIWVRRDSPLWQVECAVRYLGDQDLPSNQISFLLGISWRIRFSG